MAVRKTLTDLNVSNLEVRKKKYEVWDTQLPWLCVRVEGSGTKTFYFVYSRNGRARWFRIGPEALGAKQAKIMARELIGDVARGRDPQAERSAQRTNCVTFAQLHHRYLEEHAKKRNKSWEQANSLMIKYVLRPWGDLSAAEITRPQVRALFGKISADRPPTANSVKAAISAVFAFAVKEEVVAVNPCEGIEDNDVSSRDRVLFETEMPVFWEGCELVDPVRAAALKAILLTGQRPGEVSHMRREHIRDNWWEMPGRPEPELKWPGTKNGSSHRIWLSAPVRELIAAIGDEAGFVFASERGNAVGNLDEAMRRISAAQGLTPPVRPHDLRRTAGTTITGRGHGREAMDRILNHRKKSVGDIYDRHDYAAADKRIMEDLANAIIEAVEGRPQDNVVAAFKKMK
jgi:integrase